MPGKPNVTRFLPIWLVLSLLVVVARSGLTSVSVGNSAINAITSYTWAITFNAGLPYQPLTLNFPTQVTILANRTCTIGGLTQSISSTNNSITISSTISTASVTIVCSNIQNPSSAISTSLFSYSNSKDGTVALNNVNQVQFQGGTLASCPWSFSLCTEQPNSELSIAFTTINTIPSGSNYFLIGYSTTYPNHRSKGLVPSGTTSFTCTYTLNSTGPFTASSCSVNLLTI